MKIKKINKRVILKYALLFFILLVFANANIGKLNPFLYSLFFAGLYVGINEKILALLTLACSVLVMPGVESFFSTLTVVAVGLIFYYALKLFKKRYNMLSTFVTYLIGLVTFIYYNHENIELVLFYCILGLICLFIFIVVMQVLLVRSNCFKLTLDESICFLFFLSVIGLGLSEVYIYNFSIFRLFISLAIFLCVAISSPTTTYAIILSLAFGASVSTFSIVPVGEFIIIAMLSSVFAMPNKFKITLMAIIGDFVVQFFFISKSVNLLVAILPIIIASAVFICLPSKFLRSLSDLVYVKKSELSSRNAINTTRKNIKKRMAELSNVFLDMKQIHLNMIKKELTKDELMEMISREVISTCCRECIDKNRCTRSLGTDNKSNLNALIDIAITKGRISLLDIPQSLSNRCVKVNNLISLVNRLTEEFKQYKQVMADVNNIKILLADQMGAVSQLLLDVGDEIDANVKFDIAKENKIISRLLSNNIQCREVLLYTERNEDISAVLIIKSGDAYNPTIEKTVGDILKCPMQISKVLPLEDGCYNSVTLIKRSKYDCVFGLSSCSKSGETECGDCHSIIRLNKSKFLLALCDGMGSGKNAHQLSAATLGLIENFYKAGFDNEIIMESVNKLLAVNNREDYSTLDICLIDLENQFADFIKVGSPFGLIKRENSIEKIEGGALPIGALDSVVPSVCKTTISAKDIVIMATDGIIDAFETEDNLIEFVSKIATNNPQVIADSILNQALLLNNMSAKDDMTVLVARTYLKN